jgi:hypothetical protein
MADVVAIGTYLCMVIVVSTDVVLAEPASMHEHPPSYGTQMGKGCRHEPNMAVQHEHHMVLGISVLVYVNMGCPFIRTSEMLLDEHPAYLVGSYVVREYDSMDALHQFQIIQAILIGLCQFIEALGNVHNSETLLATKKHTDENRHDYIIY